MNSNENTGMTLSGQLHIVLRDGNGKIKEQRVHENLIVTAGLTFICSRMKEDSETAMSHMALGSGSTAVAAGDTDLATLLGSREAIDSATASTNTVVYLASFEAGDATGAVVEAGVFNASTSGTMLCRTVFPVVNKAADDTMSVTWTITLTAS